MLLKIILTGRPLQKLGAYVSKLYSYTFQNIHYNMFITYVSELVSLGKNITKEEKVGKILRYFPRAWEPKVMAIQEGKNLKTLDFDEFIGSLIAYEGNIQELEMEDNVISRRDL
ncbi:hypothetical protein NC651_038512 [Populus alba x Populus x berolinensis]|nr:hypothetical protein NC651_038512 [Populus alba x Populus x berolinensis]